MHLKRTFQIIVLLIISSVFLLAACTEPVSTPVSTSTESKVCPESAQQFWKKFRSAVLKEDMNALADMTHFPLEVYTSTESFSERSLYRNNFNKHFTYLLNLGLGGHEFDPYPKPIPASMKEFARAVSKLEECVDGGTRFQLGMWMFQLYPEGFRFTAVAPNDFQPAVAEKPLHTTSPKE